MNIVSKLARRNADAFENAPVLIACLGDSVTHGCFEVWLDRFGHIDGRCDQEDGYVSGIRRRLNRLYPTAAVSVLNAGIGGDNAPGGLKRLERDVLRFSPDLVTVNFGLNDAMSGMEGLGKYRDAMDGIFARLIDGGIESMLVTPNRMCSYVSSHIAYDRLREIAAEAAKIQNDGVLDAYVQTAREVAARRGVPVADAYRVWCSMDRNGVDTTAMLCNDINHPTPEAHGIFVEAIIQQMLEGGN